MGEFGKFESLEALLHGYAELEKAYTKKCQKLSILEKNHKHAKNEECVENAEFDAENAEHSVKNSQNDCLILENIKNACASGIIENEDACCDSTACPEPCSLESAEVEKENKKQQDDMQTLGSACDKQPIYLSPLWVADAKAFFESSALAAAVERQVLDLIATDETLACQPDALLRAAERIIGESVMKNEIDDSVVTAVACQPQIRQKVIDLYLKDIRGRKLPPLVIRTRCGAAAGKMKFDSIDEAGNHLLGRL